MADSDDERKRGWKPSASAVVLLIIAAVALSGLTCWAFKINPLPSTGAINDSGWFLTIAVVYFFILYLTVESVRRRRRR